MILGHREGEIPLAHNRIYETVIKKNTHNGLNISVNIPKRTFLCGTAPLGLFNFN